MALADLLQPRLTELGKIKIGGKGAEITSRTGNRFRPPTKLDHFIVTTLHRDNAGSLIEDDELMKRLSDKYGSKDGKLRQIPVRLLSNDIEECLQSAWVWYGGKVCGARSDGKTVTWFNDYRTGRKLDKEIVEDWKPEFEELKDSRGAKLFKLHTILSCIVSDEDAKWGGVYKFRTTSRITANQLYGSLVHLATITGGVLMGLPLMLVVRPIQVAPDGKPTTVYVVHAELRGPDMQAVQKQALQIAEFQVHHRQQIESLKAQYRKLLPGPGMETSTDDIEDVSGEFHPETSSALASASAVDPILAGVADEIIEAEIEDAAPQHGSDAPPPADTKQFGNYEEFRTACIDLVAGTDVTEEQVSGWVVGQAVAFRKNNNEPISPDVLSRWYQELKSGKAKL